MREQRQRGAEMLERGRERRERKKGRERERERERGREREKERNLFDLFLPLQDLAFCCFLFCI